MKNYGFYKGRSVVRGFWVDDTYYVYHKYPQCLPATSGPRHKGCCTWLSPQETEIGKRSQGGHRWGSLNRELLALSVVS